MNLKQLFHATETIRKHANEREFPAQVISVFLAVASARNQDLRQGDLQEICGMSASSVSRNISWLGPRNKLKRRDGLRWIEIYEAPKTGQTSSADGTRSLSCSRSNHPE